MIEFEQIAEKGRISVFAIEAALAHFELFEFCGDFGPLRSRAAPRAVSFSGFAKARVSFDQLGAQFLGDGLAPIVGSPQSAVLLPQLGSNFCGRVQRKRGRARHQQVVDVFLHLRVERGQLPEFQRIDFAEDVAREPIHPGECSVSTPRARKVGPSHGDPRLASLQQDALDAAEVAGAVELELALKFELLWVFGIPICEWVFVSVGGLESVKDGFNGRAKRRFAGFVRSVHEYDVGVDRKRALLERAECDGVEADESHASPSTMLRSMSSSGSSSSSSRR